MDGLKAAKRRKVTSKALPSFLTNPVASTSASAGASTTSAAAASIDKAKEEIAESSAMYTSLLETERRLDWTMSRKKVEVQDALSRGINTTRTLRIFMSHTVSNQVWQADQPGSGELGEGGMGNVDLQTGEGVPAWQLKIEGRLLDNPNTARVRGDKFPIRKFSTFVKKMVVELERDPALYPDGNIVEWPKAPSQNPALDGFTIRRTGDVATRVRVVMYLEQFPEQFKVANELGSIIGVKEDSRLGVITALWNYIKIQNLQDKVDRRMVHADEKLFPLFGGPSASFHKLPELVNRFLIAPDPIVLHYTIDPSVPPSERPTAWDMDIQIEDTTLKSRMTTLLVGTKESLSSLAKIDEEIALRVQSLHNSQLKLAFLEEFANDPNGFIAKWLESQSRDLETILGSGPSDGATVRKEELKRSEFFQLPWVEEAVAVHEGHRLTTKVM